MGKLTDKASDVGAALSSSEKIALTKKFSIENFSTSECEVHINRMEEKYKRILMIVDYETDPYFASCALKKAKDLEELCIALIYQSELKKEKV